MLLPLQWWIRYVLIGLIFVVNQASGDAESVDTLALDQPDDFNNGEGNLQVEGSALGTWKSTRPGTVQNWVHVTSTYACKGGLNEELLSEGKVVSTCTCTKARLPRDHAIQVSVDLPCGSGPFPIVWMLHGVPEIIVNSSRLVTTSNSFNAYVQRLLKAGFAVLQYDALPDGDLPFSLPADTEEAQFAKQVIDWLKITAREDPSSGLYRKLDSDHIALAGHSVGGKIAAYIYAKGAVPGAYTAFLIDPVDNSCLRPATSNCFPSALDALEGQDLDMSILSSTIRGCLNPASHPSSCALSADCTAAGAEDFFKVAGPNSDFEQVPFGHFQLADPAIPGTEELANLFAGFNSSVTNLEAQDYVADRLVQWTKARLLQADPAYERHLQDYEKGLCPVTQQKPQGLAGAQAPAGTMDPQETQHGLLGASFAAAAEAAPSLHRAGLS